MENEIISWHGNHIPISLTIEIPHLVPRTEVYCGDYTITVSREQMQKFFCPINRTSGSFVLRLDQYEARSLAKYLNHV